MATVSESTLLELPKTIRVETISKSDGTGAIICDTGAVVHVLDRTLELSYQLPADHIAPLFSGAAWAGTMIWEAALLMAEYLIHTYPNGMASIPVVELGAGIGLPGMVAALLGAEVTLTEQEDLVSLLRRNISFNFPDGSSQPQACTLDWGDLSEPGDLVRAQVVLCCDCVYEPLYGDSWRQLLQVLRHFTGAQVLVSLERRTADGVDRFLREFEEGFDVQVVVQKGPLMLLRATARSKEP